MSRVNHFVCSLAFAIKPARWSAVCYSGPGSPGTLPATHAGMSGGRCGAKCPGNLGQGQHTPAHRARVEREFVLPRVRILRVRARAERTQEALKMALCYH